MTLSALVRVIKKQWFVVVVGLLGCLLGGFYLFFSPARDVSVVFPLKNVDSEVLYEQDSQALENVPPDFISYSNFFKTVAEREGGQYAYELLKRVAIPLGIDVHLLGHVIGYKLFDQQGIEGMKFCTHDFRNACSHTIVISALLKEGIGVLDRISSICEQAPGGRGAYTMCFHGLGHGVLAYAEYEMPQAIELCRQVGMAEHNNNEFSQCVGGMIMEMHDGVHDPEVWEEKAKKYLNPDNPLELCQAEYMPDEAKYMCYMYITPFMFDAAGGQVDEVPSPEIIAQAFPYCENEKDDRLRGMCYGGFGKEFVVLVQGRDIRQTEAMPDNQLATIIRWCGLANDSFGILSCIYEAQNSLYWGGENDYNVSIRYCSLLSGPVEGGCFEHMFQNVNYYEQDPLIRAEICEAAPLQYQNLCHNISDSNDYP